MCGVVGLWVPPSRARAGRDLREALTRMSACVAHRGPDDRGEWFDPGPGVGIGHRRLSIVDLSSTGHQPMTSTDGRWVVAVNGEVYDHAKHRGELVAAGVRFRGSSDIEVLVELIARHGLVAALERVDGMFAMAVWDREQQTLHLARDRMGEKPLYYGTVGGAFAFASELTALRAMPGLDGGVDPIAVAEYLRLGYVPAPLGIHPGTRKLSAGSILSVTADSFDAEPVTYWSLRDVAEYGVAHPLGLPEDELVDSAEELLTRALRTRIEADVPVGAFLSGGLDSSTIVALAQRVSDRPVRTFTVAVGGADDESDAASTIARHLGTDHTTLPLPELDALALAEGVATTYDEPFADPSAIPVTLLCAAARRHVTVALSGDAGDELLAGYNRYRVAHGRIAQLRGLPLPVKSGIAGGLRALPPAAWDRLGSVVPGVHPALGTKLHKLASALVAPDVLDSYHALASQWDPASVMSTYPGAVPTVEHLRGGSDLERMLFADQKTTLPDNMLVKVDRASMAAALEVRVPFLERRFVEFTWQLPQNAKVRGGQGKWLVRQLLARHVPSELWDRPKLGFDPPLADWLRGPLREWAHDLLAPAALQRQGLLRAEPVQRALAEHLSGRRNHDYLLWTVLTLQSWLERN